jgi:thiol-disulfide isomerase/thioredoxin
MRIAVAVGLLALVQNGCTPTAERPSGIAENQRFPLRGSAAPAWHLIPVDSSQGVLTLASDSGHVVILAFWASWCGPCQEELPELSRLAAKYRDQGLRVYTVLYDDELIAAQKWMRTYNVELPLLLDPGKRTATDYLVLGLPSAYVIARNGSMWRKEEGYQGPGHWERRLRGALAWRPPA